jgi:hypothetical protein
MEDDRFLTRKEELWVKRLKKCLAEMPSSIELNVGHGEIKVCNVGALNRALEINSSDDLITIEYVKTKRVNPDSESL